MLTWGHVSSVIIFHPRNIIIIQSSKEKTSKQKRKLLFRSMNMRNALDATYFLVEFDPSSG